MIFPQDIGFDERYLKVEHDTVDGFCECCGRGINSDDDLISEAVQYCTPCSIEQAPLMLETMAQNHIAEKDGISPAEMEKRREIILHVMEIV